MFKSFYHGLLLATCRCLAALLGGGLVVVDGCLVVFSFVCGCFLGHLMGSLFGGRLAWGWFASSLCSSQWAPKPKNNGEKCWGETNTIKL